MKKGRIDQKTIFVVIAILTIIIFIYVKNNNYVNEKLAKCIASKSTLYVSTGCVACKYQEEIFGDSFKYLNVVDCAVNPEKCSLIIENGYISTPSWIINNKKYTGVQSIEKLKELTGC